jgi:hypothetical protein
VDFYSVVPAQTSTGLSVVLIEDCTELSPFGQVDYGILLTARMKGIYVCACVCARVRVYVLVCVRVCVRVCVSLLSLFCTIIGPNPLYFILIPLSIN